MAESVLVAYHTRYGATAEVAEAVARELRAAGLRVDLGRIGESGGGGDPGGADAVVLGAPIFGRALPPEVTAYVSDHADALRGRPVAMFLIGLTLADPDEDDLDKAEEALEPVRDVVRLVDIGRFGGATTQLPWLLRVLVRLRGSPRGDMRDWDAISTWARDLAVRLRDA